VAQEIATPAWASAGAAGPAARSGIAAYAASALLTGQELENVVKNIMDMGRGYDRDQVRLLIVLWGS
jgi:hypothetical protein